MAKKNKAMAVRKRQLKRDQKRVRQARKLFKSKRPETSAAVQKEDPSFLGRVGKWMPNAAARFPHALVKKVTFVTEELSPPRRHGKRKKIQEPTYNEFIIGPRRTWSGVTTFSLVVMFLLTFAAGMGAMNGWVLGPQAICFPSITVGASGLVHHLGQSNTPVRSRPMEPWDHGQAAQPPESVN